MSSMYENKLSHYMGQPLTGSTQVVSLSGTPVSGALHFGASYRILTYVDCFFNLIVTGSDGHVAQDQGMPVTPGESWVVTVGVKDDDARTKCNGFSVIVNSDQGTSGKLYITRMLAAEKWIKG